MRIISMPPIYAFEAKHPVSATSLNDWCRKIKKAQCRNFNELKNEVAGSVDYVGGDLYVFNIGGNNYRLVAGIHFNTQLVYIRAILTHAEYDEHNKNKTLLSL
ncbi:type II toxin-antitoxin system HigB family toxin [Chitinophaga polysaccharea]|uniref:type II toxin-antitoxin system HigB family toxin n=1 Tax=Chitinophaga TaxID=79328 RepID=UPI001455B084|nr:MULTISPECIES: type II toxin-antitoxin system HigB family toxin [Chitinophaga]NLR56983.1 type II toxin-antitoxin system HigB family toxin [Chitinophaga polysaccharea]NLU93186.1 type II toxin-antitoxin system HigB family toxin [Chitinophaga sp. Ak27]